MTTRRSARSAGWLAASLLLAACAREEAPPAPSPAPVVEAAPDPVDDSLPRLPRIAPETPQLVPGPTPAETLARASGETEPPPAQMRPLEDLLRLPASAGRSEPATQPVLLPESESAPQEKTEKRKPSRVQVELDSRSDASLIDRNKARTRTDAGVAVDVGNETKIRTGVRVEQETGLEREDPTPTVGIERRF